MKLLPDIRITKPLDRYEWVDNMVKAFRAQTDHPMHAEACELADLLDYFGSCSPLHYDRRQLLVLKMTAGALKQVCTAVLLDRRPDTTEPPEINVGGIHGPGTPATPAYIGECMKLIGGYALIWSGHQQTDILVYAAGLKDGGRSDKLVVAAAAIIRECEGFIAFINLHLRCVSAMPPEEETEMIPAQWAKTVLAEKLGLPDNKPPF